ncbi:MAG: hypothetical protein HY080_05115 [Gammaproteobacteria bacterium]|nr:hypothetical protein [Gammaproteobacteria bacterium]
MQLPVLTPINQAQDIVNAYGELLADLEGLSTAYPVSILPHNKQLIRQAIQTLLWEIDDISPDIRTSLTQAYVFLEQFIPDLEYRILSKGQAAVHSGDINHLDWACADEANLIMTKIKVAMEEALQDVHLFLH